MTKESKDLAKDFCMECGALLPPGGDCGTRIDEILYLEEKALAGLGEEGHIAHFLAIASYQLQHPSRLTAEARTVVREVLDTVLLNDARIEEVRRHVRNGVRGIRVAATRDGTGENRVASPKWPKEWEVTIIDVLAGGPEAYASKVKAWASSTAEVLRTALGPARVPD